MVDTGVGGSVGDAAEQQPHRRARIVVSDIELRTVAERSDGQSGELDAAALVDLLARIDPAEMATDHEVLELVAAWDKVASWVAARQATAMSEFARRPVVVSSRSDSALAARRPVGSCAREFADDEIGARLRCSRHAAGARLGLALDLAGVLTATRDALSSGRIDLVRARAVAEACRGLDADVARRVEERVLPRAPHQTPSRLRECLKRAVLAVDPTGAERRCAGARAERRVVVTPAADGMAELWALLPAASATAIDALLSADARDRAASDSRTVDQRCADVLAVRLLASPVASEQDRAVPPTLRAQIEVTVPASTLLGLRDEPGHLTGYGPIPASLARELAGEGTWRRILTDPVSGTVLDVGTTTYRPPAALRRHVERRDVRCRFPGCGRRARSCDLDHTVPYPGGATAESNLGTLCRRHHRLKHAVGTTLVQLEGGVFRWTLPTGHRYESRPPAVGPSVADGRPPPGLA